MELHTLKPAAGSVKRNTKRIGRGQGSGKGGTSTKGHKGDKSRSGHKDKLGFEGGQMPLQRRIPKRGFKNFNRVEYLALNLDRLQLLVDTHKVTTFDTDMLYKMGVGSKNTKIKVLGQGELTVAINITANAFSEAAKVAIEKAGGVCTQV